VGLGQRRRHLWRPGPIWGASGELSRFIGEVLVDAGCGKGDRLVSNLDNWVYNGPNFFWASSRRHQPRRALGFHHDADLADGTHADICGTGNLVRWFRGRMRYAFAMSDIFPPSKQRQALLAFAETCGTRADKLRRDECGDWAIWGRNGHIYAVPEGFQLMIGCDFDNRKWSSARGWESAKQRLDFGKVTQDGDCEGSIILDRLPGKSEASEIRDILGIPKLVELSDEVLAAKRAQFSTARKLKPVLPAFDGDRATTMAAGL
jgi:hypothetical protein